MQYARPWTRRLGALVITTTAIFALGGANIAAAVDPPPPFHGLTLQKTCVDPVHIGDPYECAYRITNADDNNESITVSSVKDQVHAASGNVDSGELIGTLTWTVSGGASCTPPGPTTTCTLPTQGATIESALNSFYTVQAADFGLPGNALNDDVSIIWAEPVCVNGGCPVGPKTSTTGASATVLPFTPSVETLLSDLGPVAPGTMITDQATLLNASSDAGGTVSYAVYSDNTCSTLVQALGTKTVTDGVVGPSDPWTAVVGNFWFQATYSGDANTGNVGPVSSVCTSEPITVEAPGVSIVKKTNGADANDPNGADVPNIKPGDPVTWTYEVTNTGSTHVPQADVVVTDNQTGVTPAFDHEQTGNGDAIFDPGEVWIFTATGTAIDLSAPPVGVITSPDKCTHGGTEAARTAYVNLGTATIPGATVSDPSGYCNPVPPPPVIGACHETINPAGQPNKHTDNGYPDDPFGGHAVPGGTSTSPGVNGPGPINPDGFYLVSGNLFSDTTVIDFPGAGVAWPENTTVKYTQRPGNPNITITAMAGPNSVITYQIQAPGDLYAGAPEGAPGAIFCGVPPPPF